MLYVTRERQYAQNILIVKVNLCKLGYDLF